MTIVTSPSDSVRAGLPEPAGGVRTWREELKAAVRDPAQLLTRLELPQSLLEPAKRAAKDFPLFVPLGYVDRMAKGRLDDPLLRQVLPLEDELRPVPGFSADAVGDQAAKVAPGLIQKYDSRALLISTGACAVHCRYCFRRQYPYEESPRSPADWQNAIDQLATDPAVDEVILSGGDPLTLVDDHLAELAQSLERVPQLMRLRVHTRLPVLIPQRVTNELIAWLKGTRLAPIMVIHANHAQEIDDSVAVALAKLVDAGIPVLNQTVLLRGVNDSVEALADLSRRLVNLRVMPYYLHQLDRVAGAAHFEVTIERGLVLIDQLRSLLPGYAVPRYVQEIAGEAGKRVLA